MSFGDDDAMKPLFSIITVCLNENPGIRRTCESIIGLAHEDYEWIVIDGASNDGTLEILGEYKDSITCLVSEPDLGIYDAMNKGIAKAQGEYLIFMNGGDCFASPEVLTWAAAAPRKDLIYGNIFHDEPERHLVLSPERMNQGYLLKNMVPHQATFYHHTLFERFGKYDTSFRIAGDYDLYVRLLEIGRVSHHHINQPLAVFDLTGISNSEAFRALRKQENHRIRMKYFRRYRWSLKALRQKIRDRRCK